MISKAWNPRYFTDRADTEDKSVFPGAAASSATDCFAANPERSIFATISQQRRGDVAACLDVFIEDSMAL